MKDNVKPNRPPHPRRIVPLALQGARTNFGGFVGVCILDDAAPGTEGEA